MLRRRDRVSTFKITPTPPVVHIPSFQKWGVPRAYVAQILELLGLEPLYPWGVHKWYWYTNEEGALKLVPHLLLKSSLYKPDKFTCINYAFRVWNECSLRFELNTWIVTIGRIPNYEPRHAWNLIMMGDEKGLIPENFLFFEPNDGWQMGVELEMAYQAFPIGEAGYKGELEFH